MKIKINETQINILKKIIKEENTPNPLDGKRNQQARRIINKVGNKYVSTGIYKDIFWEGKQDVLKGLNEYGIKYVDFVFKYNFNHMNTALLDYCENKKINHKYYRFATDDEIINKLNQEIAKLK